MKLKDNILLDLGGVLINLDLDAAKPAFESLRIKGEPTNKQLTDWEMGKMTEKEFFEIWKVAKWAQPSDIRKAWNSILLDIPEERIQLLKKWKKKHKLFLVSNTNPIHIKAIAEGMGIFRWNQFIKLFDGVYLSYEVGKRKPNKNFFEHVLKDADLDAKECTFIDDTAEHVKAAAKLGIDAYRLKVDEESILDLGKAR